MEYVRLADPDAAPAVADRLQAGAGERRETGAVAWQQQREDVGERYESTQIALELLSALLLLCATPIVATLVSERILARGRELAILRAGGLTPGGIVMLNGVFYGVLGALGGLLGLIGGTLVSPWVAGRSEELLSAPETVGPTATAAIAVVVGTAVLAALAAAVPAWLLSRRPATEALASAKGGGRRRPSRLAHLARGPGSRCPRCSASATRSRGGRARCSRSSRWRSRSPRSWPRSGWRWTCATTRRPSRCRS